MKTLIVKLMAVFMTMMSINMAVAKEVGESGLELPRMVSLRSSLVNARSGPGTRYPIEWVYRQKGMPIEIISEFEIWRKVKDWEGTETWVHKAMLSGRRFVKVINPGENNVYAKADKTSKIIAKVEDGVVGEIEKCPQKDSMCLVKFEGIQGWIPRIFLFGVYDKEVIK